MTDTPKRFPYGGGTSKWVNPRLVAERARAAGVEIAELPSLGYTEPAYDEPTLDGERSLPHPDVETIGELDFGELDFDAPFLGAPNRADRPAFVPEGISAAEHMATREFDFVGWECDCKATAKTGIPPRHFLQYVPHPYVLLWPYRVMVKPGRETKQAKGGENAATGATVWIECPTWWPTSTITGWACSCPVGTPAHKWDGKRASKRHEGRVGAPVLALIEAQDDAPVAEGDPVECPTWRRAPRTWTRPGRDWSKHGIKAPAPAQPPAQPPAAPVTHPAGPTEDPTYLEVADLPKGCQAKAIMLQPGVTSRLKVRGRRVDDGPVVQRFRIAGTATGRDEPDEPEREVAWVCYFTEGKFDGATIDRVTVNLAMLRTFLKTGIVPI